jgi:tRNA A-37 threonylcarbamoyl transferase component Bud32
VGLDTQTEATGEFGPHGTKIVPPPEAEVARRFPHLEILGCLGHGGMGVVYKARQSKLNRLVALKILAPEKGADPKFAERFLREAQALARLSHPNIVTVHDYGEADGMFFLLMEFVDGMTLRQLLREGRMKPEQALAIVPPICEALQFAHEQGVVHRDIKPENVLLDKQGRVKIADFGIAKLVGMEKPRAALTEERSVIGTPHYMAPEQVEKPTTVDHRADIYSLGVVFYEMLTGELPLGKFQPPSKKVQVDVRLDEVVLHALEKEPERRYQQASEVKTDVETIAATAPSGSSGHQSAPSESARPPAVADAKRNAKEATIVFAGTVFFLFMLAVVAEMSPRAGLFRGFLVVICVVGLVICKLSLGGIWPFPSLWFPEPNFSSRNLRRGKGAADLESEPKPRFSPTALFGAVLGITLVLTGTPFVLGWVNGPVFPGLFMILLGVCSMTLCGWVASAQIRHARGRLYGMGVAVFDALLFPLLALDALIVGAGFMALRLHTAAQMAKGPMVVPPVWVSFWWLGLIVLGVIMLVDWLIIRAVWRAVNKPVAAAPRPIVTVSRAAEWKPILAAIVSILLLGAVALGGWVLLTDRSRQEAESARILAMNQRLAGEVRNHLDAGGYAYDEVQVAVYSPGFPGGECIIFGLRQETEVKGGLNMRHDGSGTWFFNGWGALSNLNFTVDTAAEMGLVRLTRPAMNALRASFGPEREFILTEFNNMDGCEGLDLDTGTVLAQPKDVEQWSEAELAQWIKDQGADLFVDHGPGGQWGLLTTTAAELKLAIVTNANRARITERELEEALSSGRLLAHEPTRGILKVYPLPKDSPTAMTLAFKTSSGSSGLLWVAGFTDRPRGVKIGCKLLQSGTRIAGVAADLVLVLRDNMALDLDAGALRVLREEINGAELAALDVAWDNDGGGALMRNPRGKSRLLPLPDAGDFERAATLANQRRQLVEGSEDRGEMASKCRFFAVLTDQGRLAVIETKDFDSTQATVRWRFLASPKAESGTAAIEFGPVMERIVQTRLSGTTNWFLDFESGQFFMPPPELAELLTSATGPRSVEGLPGTRREQFADWANKTGVDLLVWGPTSLQTVGGIWVQTHGPSYENWDDLDWQQPAAARRAIQDFEEEMRRLSPQERASRFGIGPHTVLARDFSVIYFFKTQQGTIGVLQIAGTNSNPTGMKIRYKLVLSASTGTETPAPQSDGVKEMTLELPIKAGGLDETSQFKATLPGLELITAKLHFHPGTERTRLMIGLRFTSQSVRSARLDLALLDSSAKDARTLHRFTHVEDAGPEEVRRKGNNLDWVRRWDSSRALWFDVPIEARKAQAIQIKVQLQQDVPEEKSAVRQSPDPYRKQRRLAETMKNLKLDRAYAPGDQIELVLGTNEPARLEFADSLAGVSEFLFRYEPDGLNVFYNCEGEDRDWTVLTAKRTADSRNISRGTPGSG